jgi:hypothetical protein
MFGHRLSRRRMSRRRIQVGAAVAALISAPLAGLAAVPTTAAALTPPVAFTADTLSTWQTNGIVYALAQSGGTVFAGGTFSAVRPPGSAAGSNEQPAVNLAAFDAATGAPTSCRLSFTTSSGTATVRALAVSPDGKTLYAGGHFGAVNGVGVSSLAAIDIARCAPVTSFRPAVSATVRALAVTGDTVYLGGDFGSVAGSARDNFAALTTSGGLKPWRADADAPGRAVDVTPDGRHVVVGGDFNTVGGHNSHALAVTDATSGAVTKSYPAGFFPATSVVKSVVSDSTGVYTGNEGSGGGVFDGRTAFSLSDFSQRWRDTCLGATQALLPYHDVLYSASHAHDCSSMGSFPDGQRRHLLAEGVNDPTLLPWFPDTNDGIGEGIGPRALTTASSGGTDYLWVGGEFTTVGGTAQQGLTRVATGPDTGAPTVPQLNVSSIKPGSVQVRWPSSLDRDDGNLTYSIYKNGSSTPVHTTTGSSLPWSRPQHTWNDTDVTAGTRYSYRISVTDGTNTSAKSAAQSVTAASTSEAYPNRVLSDGAGLYWRFGDAPGTYDSDTGPSDNVGVNWKSPTLGEAGAIAGSSNTAIGFDGSSQWAYSDKKDTRSTNYSIETWFRTSTTSGGLIVGMGDRVQLLSRSRDKLIYMNDRGQLVFGTNPGGRAASTTTSYNDGRWHHVVATQSTSSGMRLYVDGTLRAGNSSATSGTSFTGYWRVGADNVSGWPSRPSSNYFNGRIDETAVYPSVLSAAQIAQHRTLGTTG